MNPDSLKSVYFLGIGGIGMSSLARYFARKGVTISGYDRTPTALTGQLINEGMDIHFKDDLRRIPRGIDLVIYTPAIPADHKEFQYFKQGKIPMKKRAEVLGMIASSYKTIAVAGTHGKTTTSTLIAHILRTAGINQLAFLGGISKNYDTNFLCPEEVPSTAGQQKPGFQQPVYCVVEADEYDRSFLHLHPDIAIITSADADHLDSYRSHQSMLESYGAFTEAIRDQGSLIMKLDIPVKKVHRHSYYHYSYALNQEAAFFAKNIRLKKGLIHFDFIAPNETISNLVLGIPGLFNLENAIAALAVGYLTGIRKTHLKNALKSYQGVQRRFDFRICRRDLVYIDDYAHHPEELRACISAARELYPNKKLTGIFQPHLFSRTRDLASGFARSLELLDEVLLLDIYPAREKPIRGVTSRLLLDQIKLERKKLINKDEVIRELKKDPPEVLLTLGAGDIDLLVKPVTDALNALNR